MPNPSPVTQNLLGRETSPYLLQHRDNPVHWRAWGPEALAEAAACDKPILLSIGYAACHWCHVMAHESFEDPAIAALMNELFVSIKVDREERPDIDQIYQHALALLGQQGGWPLTMFLLPDGQPFWGGTYFPPAPRWGRPGFPDALRGIAKIYHEDKERVAGNVEALRRGLGRLAEPAPGGPIDIAKLDLAAERLADAIDMENGGIRGAPKFPNCSVLELLWRAWHRTQRPRYRDAVLLSLERMCQGGIYDHVGGGFARYSTDERWLAPHFEKMLYDNAQLIELLTWAWQETKAPLYRWRVDETVTWLLREMRAEGGAFAATIDADSEHEEGKFYVWTEAQIDEALGSDSALFKQRYDVTPGGNWEGKTILNRLRAPTILDVTTESVLAKCRARLLMARSLRIPPERDDKVLADWNGLMIAALAHAAVVFEQWDWLAAAVEAWRFVTGPMMPSDRLRHAWRLGRSHPGTLDDHAAMSVAALALHESTGDRRYLDQAEAWAIVVERHYAAPGGGYYLTADDTEALITRTKTASDSAVPSGNGLMLKSLATLAALTGKNYYAEKADILIGAFSGELDRDFFGLGAYLNAVDLFANMIQIVIIGVSGAADTNVMRRAVYEQALPNRILQLLSPDQKLPASHPAAGKTQVGGVATAYVCRGRTCSLPMVDPDLLRRELMSRPRN